jgi:hypothetical protein
MKRNAPDMPLIKGALPAKRKQLRQQGFKIRPTFDPHGFCSWLSPE